MKVTKYVDPNQYDAVMKKRKERSEGMMGPVEFEVKAVDLNHAYVPMGEMTQEAKESDEHLRKTEECNAARFGLSGAGVPSY